MDSHKFFHFTTSLWLLISIALSSIISAQIIDDQPPTPVASPEASDQIDPHHTLSFFMHDILGGSTPSARIVTNNQGVNGRIPFAKPYAAVLPLINTANIGFISSYNVPFLPGLSGTTSSVIQSNGEGGLGLPDVNGVQFMAQKLVFGTMTVFDDELTEGQELGSGLVGKAQGFYVASSEDGRSQMMAFTVMLESGEYVDSISLFGVHRRAVAESQLAVMGGTGKYVNAVGFANVKNVPAANQGLTDGIETLLEFTVYVSL